ncbi:hypothetical protein DL96DRAFT_1821785 [Flagelloscypha sp. PMI_526]|nr:hypothetical protein DL96DRAFT_1821785 [Flagelloscypha sp. PMI_526]
MSAALISSWSSLVLLIHHFRYAFCGLQHFLFRLVLVRFGRYSSFDDYSVSFLSALSSVLNFSGCRSLLLLANPVPVPVLHWSNSKSTSMQSLNGSNLEKRRM